MKGSIAALVATGLLMTACSSGLNQFQDTVMSLSEAQRQEIADWQQEANEATEPFVPTDDWEELAPGVWYLHKVDEAGGVHEGYQIEGLEGMAWMAANIWEAELENLEERLRAPSEHERLEVLQYELARVQRNLERYENWKRLSGQSQNIGALSCSAYANASAMPTTANVGAKAYANSRTCTSGYEALGQAYAYSDPNGSVYNSYRKPPGVAGSAEAVKYGYWCYSSADSEGYPFASGFKSYSCP